MKARGTAADPSAVDPRFIGYIQLSDSTVRQRGATYRDDSTDRSIPGQGELPLADILLALPAGLPVGVETPMRSRAEQGLSVQECARLAVAGAREVLATVSAARSAS